MEPEVSVIIPSLDGNRAGNVSKLIDSLKNQSFKNFPSAVELRVI